MSHKTWRKDPRFWAPWSQPAGSALWRLGGTVQVASCKTCAGALGVLKLQDPCPLYNHGSTQPNTQDSQEMILTGLPGCLAAASSFLFMFFFPSLSWRSYVPSVLSAHLLRPFYPWEMATGISVRVDIDRSWLEKTINQSFSDLIQGKRGKQLALKRAIPSGQQERLHPWNGINFYAGNSHFSAPLPPPHPQGMACWNKG